MFKSVYSYNDQLIIQKAISFLTENINYTGHNPKPVLIHSIRVAMNLYDKGESLDVIVAALLHDLIEDTDVKLEDINLKFGGKVSELVYANTFKSEITDYTKQYIETFERNISYGREAVIIKAADILDNADYYHLAEPEMQKLLYSKFIKFMEMSKLIIGNTEIWNELEEKKEKLNREMNI